MGEAMIGITIVSILLLAIRMFMTRETQSQASEPSSASIPAAFDSQRAYSYLEKICAIGPRVSGTPGMAKQQEMLVDFFKNAGAEIQLQPLKARNPQSGATVELTNIIASWFPERAERILISAHYDTRPFPDRDPRNPRGIFVGANDGASGVAVLMELAHHMSRLPGTIGVDLILFDGEELVYQTNDPYFLGSKHFAQTYAAEASAKRYVAGALVDMVGDRDLKLFYEKNSLLHARSVCQEIWGCAKELRITAFEPIGRHEVLDDHMPLNQIAKIPTADVIDFDYPRPGAASYWHTTQDTPDKCSGRSLAAVAAVMFRWLEVRSGVRP